MEPKKTYTPPTITDHGEVTKKTQGLVSRAYETYGHRALLDDPKNNLQNIDDQFLHTQFFALVDKSGQVRKIYDGLKKEELEELKKDIKGLLDEPVAQKRVSNNLFGN